MAEAYGEKFTFTWKIENVSYFTLSETKSIKSPSFCPYATKEDKISLSFYPRKLPESFKTLVDDRNEVLLISNLGMTRDSGIPCQVEALGKDEVVKLKNLHPNLFVLTRSTLEKILKSEDTVTFKYYLNLIDAVEERIFAPDCKAVTKSEIHRECFKTTINLRNPEENKLFVMSSHFVIDLIHSHNYKFLRVEIEQTKSEEISRENRYLNGKFLLVSTKSTEIIAFEVGRYLDSHEKEWLSKSFGIRKKYDLFYFSCDIKTGGMQTEFLIKSNAELLRDPEVKDHLRYVSATKEYPDILLRVKNTDIAAHKIILASKSSVLAQLIENKDSCLVKMNNYDLKTVTKFLDFLYYGELPESNFQNASMLHRMAEFYKVDTLVAKCISLKTDRTLCDK